MSDEIGKYAIKALLLEILGYGAVGFGGLYVVSDGISSFGSFTAGLGVLVFAALIIGLFKYRPNVEAHRYMSEWLGADYEKMLQDELEKSSYNRMFKYGWFVKQLEFAEKVYPSPIKKKLMEQVDQEKDSDQ